jgi:hypothetical protein
MKPRSCLLLIIALISFPLLFVFYFFWPPDMWRGSIWLAHEYINNGCEIALRQHWGPDLYSTHVLIYNPNKGWTKLVLDADDVKWWLGRIVYDSKQRKIYLYNGSRLVCIIELDKEIAYMPGREHYPHVPWKWQQYTTNTPGKCFYFL